MNRNLWGIILVLVSLPGTAQYRKYSYQQPKMGSLFSIVIYTRDSAIASQAAANAYRLIDTLNDIYSDYNPKSELNRLCSQSGTGKWVKVSPTLYSILSEAYQASVMSNGTFDVTAGPLVRLWRTARTNKMLPQPDSLRAALQRVGYRLLGFNRRQGRVRLKVRGMQLDLGGIAKGETAQKVYEGLSKSGFPYSLVDAGGDVVAGSVPPDIDGWHVGINLPESEDLMQQQLLLANLAVTTSGDLYQYVLIDGKRYSHIINPLTGNALTNSRNVTVISKKGITADWLTKACSVMPVESAMNLVKKYPGTELQIAELKNGQPVFFRTPGFETYFKKARL